MGAEKVTLLSNWTGSDYTSTITASTNTINLEADDSSVNATKYLSGGGGIVTGTTNLSAGLYKISFDASWTNAPSTKIFTWYSDGSTSTNETISSGSHLFYKVVDTANGNSIFNIQMNNANQGITLSNISIKEVTNDLVGYWGLDADNSMKALDFDGTGDTIEVAHHSSINFTTTLTVCAWVQKTSTGYTTIVDKKNSSAECFKIDISSDGDGSGRVRSRVYHDGGSYKEAEDSRANYNDSKWHFIAMTYEGGTALKVYVDGSLGVTNTTSIPATMDTSTDSLYIGSFIGTNYYHDGLIAQAGVYNKILSASEILTQYNLGIDGDWSSDDNLQGYWKMTTASTSSDAVVDLSPNSNHGTISGNPALVDNAVALDSTSNNNDGSLI